MTTTTSHETGWAAVAAIYADTARIWADVAILNEIDRKLGGGEDLTAAEQARLGRIPARPAEVALYRAELVR